MSSETEESTSLKRWFTVCLSESDGSVRKIAVKNEEAAKVAREESEEAARVARVNAAHEVCNACVPVLV